MKKVLILIVVLMQMPLLAFAQPDLSIVWQKNIFPTMIEDAQFSADGRWIYCVIGNTIHKMDAENGEFVSVFDNKNQIHGIYDMEVSKGGNYIVTANEGGGMGIWDTQSESVIKYFTFEVSSGENVVSSITISPDERYILIGAGGFPGFPKLPIYKIVVFDLLINKEINRLDLEGRLNMLRFSQSGKYFVTAGYVHNEFENKDYDQIILWNSETWEKVKILENIEGTGSGYRFIKYSNNDEYVGVVRRGPWEVHIYDLQTHELVKSSDGRGCVNLAFLPDSLHYILSYFPPEFYKISTHEFIGAYTLNLQRTQTSTSTKKIFVQNGTEIYLMEQILTDVNELPISDNKFKVYSDNGKLFVELFYFSDSKNQILISDLLGNIRYTKELEYIQQNVKIELNSNLPTGIYFCKITDGTKEYSQKFEIVR